MVAGVWLACGVQRRYTPAMQSKAATVAEYLASLPEDRRSALQAVRRVFLDNLDKQYAEGMSYGMIGYAVPHSVYPPGYHCNPKQPLPFAGLASQKGHMSLYLMCLYGDATHEAWFRAEWAKTGKKLDMGKACIRFKKVEDLALDVLAEAIRRVPVKAYIARYEQMLGRTGGGVGGDAGKDASKRATKKVASKNVNAKKPAVKRSTKKASVKKPAAKKSAQKKAAKKKAGR